MSRRTKKRDDGWYDINLVIDENVDKELKPLIIGEYLKHSLNKLGQIEDIEDDFKCEFIFLNKICQNGVYCYKRSIKEFNSNSKRLGEIIHIKNSDIYIQFFGVHQEKRMGVSIMGCIDYVYHSLPIKDYGITWALTREELL